MSYSKPVKVNPVLTPDQRRKWKGQLTDKQLFWNAQGVGIHLEYHDVDPSFMSGMLKQLFDEYSGKYSVKVPDEVRYPSLMEYNEKHEHLKPAVKDLKLTSSRDFNRVNRYLERLNRIGIPTETGHNNLFKSVRIQLHCPAQFADDMMRHQIASYMIEIVDFLFPIMEPYLKRLNISFNTYVMGVYNGRIWADEYILGTIGKMFNIRISVVSPYLSDIWNVFHDGLEPADVVLIANGMDFIDVRYPITHFSATRGDSKEWKCVGYDIKLKDIGLYQGETDGRRTAVDLFTINENRNLLLGTKKAVSAINQLCTDVENICIERDNVLKELKKLKVKVDSFKRYTAYFIEDDYDDGIRQEESIESVVKARKGTGITKEQTKVMMPEARKVTEVAASSVRGIPKIRFYDSRKTALGQELIQEALEVMDDDSELMGISSSQSMYVKKRHSKHGDDQRNVVDRFEPLEEGEIRDNTISEQQEDYTSKIRDIEKGTDDEKLSKLKKNRKKVATLELISEVSKQQRDPKELVHQRRCRVKMPMIGKPKPGDIAPSLPSLGQYENYLQTSQESDRKQTKRVFQSSRPVEADVEESTASFEASGGAGLEFVESLHDDNSEIQELVDILDEEGGSELQEAITVFTTDDLQGVNTEDLLPLQVESILEVPFTDVTSQVQKLEQPISQPIGFQKQKQHKEKDDGWRVQTFGRIPIKQEPKESSDSDDLTITKVEPASPEKVKKEPDTGLTQQRMRIVSTDISEKELRRRKQIIAKVDQPTINVAAPLISDHTYVPANVVEVASSSEGVTRQQESARIRGGDVNPELNVFIPPPVAGPTKSEMSMLYKSRCRMPGKRTVTVQQNPVATTQAAPPVAPEQQVGDRYYCHMCSKSFKDLNYFRRHVRRLCEKLTNPEMLKCRYCDKLYRHENRYLDHLSTHDGKLRRKCKQCGKRFAMETQLTRHRKMHCLQRSK